MWQQRYGNAALSASGELLSKPSKARLDLLIYVHVHLSCLHPHACPCGQSDHDNCGAKPHLSFIVNAKTQRSDVWEWI